MLLEKYLKFSAQSTCFIFPFYQSHILSFVASSNNNSSFVESRFHSNFDDSTISLLATGYQQLQEEEKKQQTQKSYDTPAQKLQGSLAV